jgi:hypothetical protein
VAAKTLMCAAVAGSAGSAGYVAVHEVQMRDGHRLGAAATAHRPHAVGKGAAGAARAAGAAKPIVAPAVVAAGAQAPTKRVAGGGTARGTHAGWGKHRRVGKRGRSAGRSAFFERGRSSARGGFGKRDRSGARGGFGKRSRSADRRGFADRGGASRRGTEGQRGRGGRRAGGSARRAVLPNGVPATSGQDSRSQLGRDRPSSMTRSRGGGDARGEARGGSGERGRD